ncbi:MAG TPA: DUF3179 domain-containing (seleno)protein [Saprospiraceae bacterium]|nr:DUF3179 domain-containing (seleno)protein [Saprospiraceae bacterium]
MKAVFYSSIVLLILFEFSRVYLIMPIPGSQRMETIDLAYWLHTWRWVIRGILWITVILVFRKAWAGSKIFSLLFLLAAVIVTYYINSKMMADKMFLEATQVVMADSTSNKVSLDRIVLGIENNGQAKAFPIQYISYHHKVFDTIGGMPIMVTYCSVCRSGRAFQPVVNGKPEKFRLVGMDHFNAMFEDQTTKSWWRQENGEAVAGPLQGQFLPEWPATQTSLRTWLQLHPNSTIMQPDTTFKKEYEDESDFEVGRPKGRLTVYDTASWHDKSWIAGVIIGEESRAYDWNELKKDTLVRDVILGVPIAIFISDKGKSIMGVKRNSSYQPLHLRNDTLTDGTNQYDLNGKNLDPNGKNLERITVYQEYWHSWKTFHPNTSRCAKSSQ